MTQTAADRILSIPLPEPAGKVAHESQPYEPEWISSADAYTADQVSDMLAAAAAIAREAEPAEPWFLTDGGWSSDDPRLDLSDAAWNAAAEAFDDCTHRGFAEWCDRIRRACRVLMASPLAR